MTRKWVFESLVTDDKDAVGLIAYALYKNNKHTLATNLRAQGKDEATIQQEVNTFHNQTLQNNTLDDYREKATNYLSEIIQRVQDDEREHFARERTKLEKQHQAELKKEKAKILKNMKDYQNANKPWLERLGNWLLSGVPGIVSSFLITSLFLGASMLLVTEQKRQEVFAELAAEYLGVPQASATQNTAPQSTSNRNP